MLVLVHCRSGGRKVWFLIVASSSRRFGGYLMGLGRKLIMCTLFGHVCGCDKMWGYFLLECGVGSFWYWVTSSHVGMMMASKVVLARRSLYIVISPGMSWPVVESCLLSRVYFFLSNVYRCMSAMAVRCCCTTTVSSIGFCALLWAIVCPYIVEYEQDE